MEAQMLARILALLELHLFTTVLVGVVYGVLFVLIFREIRKGHQALARLEGSAEHIAQMVRDLHR